MNRRGMCLLGMLTTGLAGGCAIYAGAADARQPRQGISYPVAERGNQTDEFFGVSVADPYRWLEDTESAKTRAWIDAENKVASDYFAGIPERARIKDRLTKLWDFEKFG